MQKMFSKKVILSFALVLALCIGMLPLMAFTVSANEKINKQDDCNNYSQCTTPEEALYFSETNQTYFPSSVMVNISYVLKTNSSILELSNSSTGLDINYITKNDNDNKKIDISFSCKSSQLECMLIIYVSLENGNNFSAKLYAFNTEFGVFISPISSEEAFNNYLNFMVSNERLTLDDIHSIKNQMYRETINESIHSIPLQEKELGITTYASTAGSGDTALVAYLTWQDKNGSYHTLSGVKVEIFDEDINNDELLATLTSDSSGMISFYFNNPDRLIDFENYGYDLFLKVYAGDDNAMVCRNDGVTKYVYKTKVLENVKTGETHILGIDSQVGSEINKAFQISQALITARNYAKAMGYTPTDVKVSYPHIESETVHTCYYNTTNMIQLCELSSAALDANGDGVSDYYLSAYEAWDTIMHEYGHHLEYELDLTNNVTGSHAYGDNLVVKKQNKLQGISLAWAEAWANTFAMIAQYYYQNRLSSISYVADSNFNSYNIKSVIDVENPPSSVRLGEASEWAITSILWDICDGTAENGDSIVLLQRGWWNLTVSSHAKTFSDLMNYYYSTYTSGEDKIKMGELLSYHKVAPKLRTESCENGDLTGETPFIMWEPGGVGEYEYNGANYNMRQDAFIISFYDDDYNLIFSRLITNPTVRTYQVSASDWSAILAACEDEYTICVGGKDVDNYETGYYYSGGITFSIP